MKAYQVNHRCVPDTKSFCWGSFTPSWDTEERRKGGLLDRITFNCMSLYKRIPVADKNLLRVGPVMLFNTPRIFAHINYKLVELKLGEKGPTGEGRNGFVGNCLWIPREVHKSSLSQNSMLWNQGWRRWPQRLMNVTLRFYDLP